MKINRITDKYNVAFENLTGETVDGTQVFKLNKEATVDVIDYLDGQDNLDDMQKALKLQDKAVAEITIIVENTEELEDIIKANEAKILDGTATPQDVMVANEALSDACALFGFDKPTVAGFEAMGDNPVESLKIANEGIGDTIAKGFDAIMKFFKDLFTGIWKFIKGLFGQNDDKKEIAEKNLEAANQALTNMNTDTMVAIHDSWKNDPEVQRINGKLEDALNGIKNSKLSPINKTIIQHGADLIKSFKILGIASNTDVKDLKTGSEAIAKVVKKMETIRSSREKFSKKGMAVMIEGFEKEINTIKNTPEFKSLTVDNLKDSEIMKEIVGDMARGSEFYGDIIKQAGKDNSIDISEVEKIAEEHIKDANSGIMYFSLVPKIGMSIRKIDEGKVFYRATLFIFKAENKITFTSKQIDLQKESSIDFDLDSKVFLDMVDPTNKNVFDEIKRELEKGLKSLDHTYRNYDRISAHALGRLDQAIAKVGGLLSNEEVLSEIMNINSMFTLFKAEVSDNMVERESIEKIMTAIYATTNHFKQLVESMTKGSNE